MKKFYAFAALAMVAGAAFAQDEPIERPTFNAGDPLYLTGDAANFEATWAPETPAQFTYADGVYTFEAEQVSQIKISYTPGDWDTFNLTAMSIDGGKVTKAMFGIPQDLTWWGENTMLPLAVGDAKADYKIVVSGDLKTITFTTDADIPDASIPSVYVRGDMNGWGTPDEWKFEHVDGTIYKFATPEAIQAGISFKVADAAWGEVNYSTGDAAMYTEIEYQMNYNDSNNMGFAEDFNGVIWVDIASESPKFEAAEDVDYVPEWVSAVSEIASENDAPAVYYNLQGVRVANPENGLFIVVKGNKTFKTIVK